jgi:hypothetical protein
MVLVPAVAAWYLASACGVDAPAEQPQQYDYVAVCTDPRSGDRVDDDKCGNAPQDFHGEPSPNTSFLWFYMTTSGGHSAPPVGQRIDGIGSYTTPKPSTASAPPAIQRGGVPSTGGPITRGGFGMPNPGSSGS